MKLLFLGGPGNISESAISYFLDNGDTVAVIKRTKGGLMGFEGKIAVYYGDRGSAGRTASRILGISTGYRNRLYLL